MVRANTEHPSADRGKNAVANGDCDARMRGGYDGPRMNRPTEDSPLARTTRGTGKNRAKTVLFLVLFVLWGALIYLRRILSVILAFCFCLDVLFALANVALIYVPVFSRELLLWRQLNVNRWRHWITWWRDPGEPLEMRRTMQIARGNLLWHLFLTALFGLMTLWALIDSEVWLRSLSTMLILPAAAYLAASIVQRQKFAIVTLRGVGRHGGVHLFPTKERTTK